MKISLNKLIIIYLKKKKQLHGGYLHFLYKYVNTEQYSNVDHFIFNIEYIKVHWIITNKFVFVFNKKKTRGELRMFYGRGFQNNAS